MATVPIKVPGVGESVTEGILARWLKPDGAAVKEGEPLFELETDKATGEVPAPASGTLRVQVQEGETVEIGAVVGSLDTEAKPSAARDKPDEPEPKAEPKDTEAAAQKEKEDREPEPAAKLKEAERPAARRDEERRPSTNGGGAPPLSPAARRLVTEEQLEPETIEGTGPGGLITKGDVLSHLERAPDQKRPTRRAEAEAEPEEEEEPEEEPSVVDQVAPEPPRALLEGQADRQTRRRMSGIRQKIAQRLVEVQRTAAILTTFNEADMSRVLELRARYKEAFQTKHDVNLGFMSFFVKASIEALKAFPAVNGFIDGSEIVYNHDYNIGVAVSTERGLMVPVVRNADQLGFAEVEKAIADFAAKARTNKITVSDLQGGTFTITNGGVFGSLLSTPILNPPQSGILGMHAIQKRPVVVNDQMVVRPMMYLAFSYDHRIIDGREAVTFLVRIKECIENPERMMLDV